MFRFRYYDDCGKMIKSTEFPCGSKYQASLREGSFESKGDRVIKLGTNMYSAVRPTDTTVSNPAHKSTMASSAEEVLLLSGVELKHMMPQKLL